jgi:PAS domain S-box-containing protein/putative nucleotidyltransferase with HDIG domain
MSAILIVDDHEQNRYLLRVMLTASGYEVLEAANGAEALELARRTQPDLIISDILMPQMDGFALCRECKRDERLRDTPIVFYTATYTDPRDEALAMQLGAARFIVKPIDNEVLIAIVNEVLRGGTTEQLAAPQPPLEEDMAFYRLYNEALIRKLEDKMLDLERLNRNLVESEERFRRLAENAPDLIYRYELTPHPGFAYVSQAAIAVTGYTPEEYYADLDLAFKIVHPDDRSLLEKASWGETASGQPLTLRWVRKDKQITWIEQRNVPVFDSAGNLIAIEGIARDITTRKQHERELETIAAVSAALRVAPTRAEMLPIILDQLLVSLEGNGAALVMLDPTNGDLRAELGRGVWEPFTGVLIPSGAGLSGQVFATGQPYLNNDTRNDPSLFRPDAPSECPCVAGAPLAAQGKIIGLLCICRERELTDDDLRLLIAISDMAANAIHRAALHEETARRLEQLQALRTIDRSITAGLDLRVTLNVLLAHVATQLQADATAVLLFDPHLQTLDYAAGRGFRTRNAQNLRIRLGENFAGRAALERRIVHIDDIAQTQERPQLSLLWAGEGFTGYYGVPLIVKGQVKGVLEVYHRAPFHPDPDWIPFLETLAGQAALAIDNAQLFENLEHSNTELILAYDTTIEGWSHALDLRDKETEGHTLRVTEVTLRLAKAMGIGEAELVHIRRGALLHDIGKMGVPDSILLKPDKLTDEEWKLMREHPQLAYDLISRINYLRPALDIPYCHHEKWDGTGYPRGLKGEQIPLSARLFAVVDVWDALSSDRPYRSAWPEDKVIEHIRLLAGTHFDPKAVELFLQVVNEGAPNAG